MSGRHRAHASELAACATSEQFAIDRVELLQRAREVYSARDKVARACDRRDRKAVLFRARQRLAGIQASRWNSSQPDNSMLASREARIVTSGCALRGTLDADIAHAQEQIESILACSMSPGDSHEDGAQSLTRPDPVSAALHDEIARVERSIDRILACAPAPWNEERDEGARSQAAVSATGLTMLAALEMEVAAVEATQTRIGTG